MTERLPDLNEPNWAAILGARNSPNGFLRVAHNDDGTLKDIPPSGMAGGDLGDEYPDPSVKGITETSGPTSLLIGAIHDGQFLKRVGETLVSAAVTGASGTVLPGWFNVEDYGAVHDGTTDDTAAIHAMITAIIAAGGGTGYFPPGDYAIHGAQQSGSNGGGSWSGQILFPARANTTLGGLSIQLLGPAPVTWFYPGLGSDGDHVPVGGARLISNLTAGNVFDAIPSDDGTFLGTLTNIHVTIDSLSIHVPQDPQGGGVRGWNLQGLIIRQSIVSPLVNGVDLTFPTGPRSIRGVTLPQASNGAWAGIYKTWIAGFPTGLEHSENNDLYDCHIVTCQVCFKVRFGSGPTTYDRCSAAFSTIGIQGTTGETATVLGNIAFEDRPGSPQLDIDNFDSTIYGELKYWRAFNGTNIPWIAALSPNNLNLYNYQFNSGMSLRPIATQDTFVKADTPYCIGSMLPSGQVWQPVGGTWGISSNKAYMAAEAGTNKLCYVQLHPGVISPTITSSFTTSAVDTNAGLLLRRVDDSNWLAVRMSKYTSGGVNQLELIKCVAGTVTSLATGMSGALATNHTYALSAAVGATTVVVNVDGVQKINYSLTGGEQTLFAGPGLGVGLYSFGSSVNDGGARWSSFQAV